MLLLIFQALVVRQLLGQPAGTDRVGFGERADMKGNRGSKAKIQHFNQDILNQAVYRALSISDPLSQLHFGQHNHS